MQQLPNNCRAGNFAVYPSNWKTTSANKNLPWRITYWFYDDTLNKRKQVVIKGMNMAETLIEKQSLVKLALEDEKHQLMDKGYNQITQKYVSPNGSEISEFTPLTEALDYAFKNIETVPNTRIDIKSCLKFITISMNALHYDQLPIGQVKRKHIKFIIEGCSNIKTYTTPSGKTKEKKWTENLFNHYRKYLSALFKVLVEIEVLDVNPIREISKKTTLTKIRQTLTAEERKIISDFLKKKYYSFWRLLQIFFHSGSREIELLRVKKEDVELAEQRFKVVVRKGKKYQEEWRTIKTIALPFWQEIMALAKPGQYLFSRGLVPGDRSIRTEQLTTRWKRHVKIKLGITADMYSLKHSNLDEIAEALDLQAAQKAAGHSTPVVTMTYAFGEKQRKHNRLKEINNAF